jgi:hypothetical protein
VIDHLCACAITLLLELTVLQIIVPIAC